MEYTSRTSQSLWQKSHLLDGVYLASFVVTSISALGESSAGAVDNLKDIIVAKFHLVSQKTFLGAVETTATHVAAILGGSLTASK